MFDTLPRTTLYLEEMGKERLFVAHIGNSLFTIPRQSGVVNWKTLLMMYRREEEIVYPIQEHHVADILFVAAGTYKDMSLTTLTNRNVPWSMIDTDAVPAYKSLDTLYPNTKCFLKRPFYPQLDVMHVARGLFQTSDGRSRNRHHLLAFYDREFDTHVAPTDPLDILYLNEGWYKGRCLARFDPTRRPVDLFKNAGRLPQRLPVLRFGQKGFLSHSVSKDDAERSVLHFQDLYGSTVICPTSDASVLEGLMVDQPDPIPLRTLLERMEPAQPAQPAQSTATDPTNPYSSLLQRLQEKEAVLTHQLAQLEAAIVVHTRIKALELQLIEKQKQFAT